MTHSLTLGKGPRAVTKPQVNDSYGEQTALRWGGMEKNIGKPPSPTERVTRSPEVVNPPTPRSVEAMLGEHARLPGQHVGQRLDICCHRSGGEKEVVEGEDVVVDKEVEVVDKEVVEEDRELALVEEVDIEQIAETEDAETVPIGRFSFPRGGLCTKREVINYLSSDASKSNRDFIRLLEERHRVSFQPWAIERIEKSISLLAYRHTAIKKEHKGRSSKIDPFLDQMFVVILSKGKTRGKPSTEPVASSSKKARGRPVVSYEDSADSTKRRKFTEKFEGLSILSTKDILIGVVRRSELPHKAEMEKVLQYCLLTPGKPAKAWSKIDSKDPIPFSEDEALALFLEIGLSVRKYNMLRSWLDQHNADVFPSYKRLLARKSKLRPSEESITITDSCATVRMQSLLDATSDRICDMQVEVIETIVKDEQAGTFIFYCSWGFDGSTGQSNYRQGYSTEDPGPFADSGLLAVTFIPLRIVHKDTGHIMWQNLSPQSIRFCRPIQLHFIKENVALIKDKYAQFSQEIEALVPFVRVTRSATITLEYHLAFTIIDGKVLNAITGTEAQTNCPICGQTPKAFNVIANLTNGKFVPIQSSLNHGISPLHAYIRLLELLLHISYRLDIKKWAARGTVAQDSLKSRKLHIQKQMYDRLHLLVDYPAPGGSGSTNNGNTARRAFSQPEVLAEILGVDLELIKRFRIILISITHSYPIDAEKFEEYCLSTFHLYIQLYPWYYMSASCHKILVHGADIVRNSILPVGMYSEQAAETKHKFYKQDRALHARRTSRIDSMTDVFHRSLEMSDPIVSTYFIRKRFQERNKLMLPKEAIDLLERHLALDLFMSAKWHFGYIVASF